MRRIVLLVVILACVVLGLSAQDLAMELGVSPVVSVPIARASDSYSIGYGANLRAGARSEVGPLFFGGSVGYLLNPTRAETNLSLVSLGAGAGTRFTPGILDLRLGAYAGGYLALYGDLVGYNPYASALASLGFDLGGGLSLGLGAEYSYFLTAYEAEYSALYQGISGFVGVSLAPGRMGAGGTREPRIRIEPPRFDRVFPVFYRYYDDNAFGSVTVVNEERGAIENVSLSFYVNGYMDAPKEIPVADRMEADERIDVPLTALWNSEVLSLTESTNVAAQLAVSYDTGGERLTLEQAHNMRIENRNVITWSDDRRAAAFVTTRDPSVLRFSRNVSALVRDSGENALNEQMRTALALFSAMELYGFDYVTDSDTPYEQLYDQEDALDYLQFPVQTLDYHAGDCDDLSILYAALLESVDVKAAFITIPGHIYNAFSLGVTEEEARRTFSRADDLIYRAGQAWVPVEATVVDQGFLRAWAIGAEQYRQTDANDIGFHPVAEAWETYEPTGFTDDTFRPILPDADQIVERYDAKLGRLVQREIEPLILELEDRIASATGQSKLRLQNRLGTVYARYGRYDEARRYFLDASLAGLGQGTFNLGNIAYLQGEFDEALGFYEQALEEMPDDAIVLVSVAKAQYELQNYAEATRYYELSRDENPEVADEFAYIIGESSSTGRASSAMQRGAVLWGDEE